MKNIFFTPLMIIAISSLIYAQNDTVSVKQLFSKLDYYEIEKLDKVEAFVWSSIIPGGGHIYCGSESALVFVVSGVAIDYWLFKGIKDHKNISLPISIVLLHKLIDIITSFNEVDAFNKKLRIKLLLGLFETGTRISFSYEL